MNVFVLCTGRCGSLTFIKACEHIQNYSARHESRVGKLGQERMAFPSNHIEADNRLSWHLGRLDEAYGDNAFYVHLKRDRFATAESFRKRYAFTGAIMPAYEKGILMNRYEESGSLEVCLDYCDTINSNISAFLKDKTRKMEFRLDHASEHFIEFWRRIDASGDLAAASREWTISHNQSVIQVPPERRSIGLRLKKSTKYLVTRVLPSR